MEIGRIPNIAPGPSATVNNGTSVPTVQTILPESQTVTSSARTEGANLTFREIPVQQNLPQENPAEEQRQERRQEEIRQREIRREFEVDRDTSALVFRAIDVESGDVLRQFPEESRLKLSAYLDTVFSE